MRLGGPGRERARETPEVEQSQISSLSTPLRVCFSRQEQFTRRGAERNMGLGIIKNTGNHSKQTPYAANHPRSRAGLVHQMLTTFVGNKMKSALLLFTITIALLNPWSLFAQEAPANDQQIDGVIQKRVQEQGIVGLAVVVIRAGEISWSKGYGLADRENNIAVDPAVTSFRWASVSKPVTAIAAMQLVDQQKLDLTRDVREYVPEFPDKGAKITAHQLLCHQSGIVHYSNGKVIETAASYADPHPYADVINALDKFKASPLIAQPGETFNYSTHGYILLSAVVQRAGQQPFAQQVDARIAQPLKMTTFQPDYEWRDIPNRAAGYSKIGNRIERRPAEALSDVSWKLGGGGFTSSAEDMARFTVGLLGDKLISESAKREAWKAQQQVVAEGKQPYGYGYGFFVMDLPNGRTLIGHDGSQSKARTALMLDPKSRNAVVLMTNSEWVDAAEFAIEILGKL